MIGFFLLLLFSARSNWVLGGLQYRYALLCFITPPPQRSPYEGRFRKVAGIVYAKFRETAVLKYFLTRVITFTNVAY